MTIRTKDDSRKRPGSPRLVSSTRRRRFNDEMSAHRILGAITAAAVVVVAAVTSSGTHTVLVSDIRRSTNERSRRLDWEDDCEGFDERGPDCFRRQYRMPHSADLRKTRRYTASPASTPPSFPRTLLDEMMSCIHQQCCTERECSTDNFALPAHP